MAAGEPMPGGRACSGRLGALNERIEGCRICVEQPATAPLPHEPRPVLRVSATARVLVCGQAPGARVHASGVPFTDPSGDRLRDWMGVTAAEFYDTSRIAILPMGFCFPGLDAAGGDLPPRKECAPAWRGAVLAELTDVRLVLLVGGYAQRWHLGRLDAKLARRSLTTQVAGWREVLALGEDARHVPLPHPSWRNNGWIARNPWFADELLPVLRAEIRRALA